MGQGRAGMRSSPLLLGLSCLVAFLWDRCWMASWEIAELAVQREHVSEFYVGFF